MTADAATRTWVPVCPAAALRPERGVAALLPDGRQVAVFRTHAGAVYAVSNVDPFSGVAVLSRGIVGDRGGAPTVTSPMHKQVFALGTGVCLDDERVRLPTFAVRELYGVVEVAVPR